MVPQEERTMLSGGNSEQEKYEIMCKRLVYKKYALKSFACYHCEKQTATGHKTGDTQWKSTLRLWLFPALHGWSGRHGGTNKNDWSDHQTWYIFKWGLVFDTLWITSLTEFS